MTKQYVDITRWKYVKDDILPLNPKMEKKVNRLSALLDDMEVIRAQYPFGTPVEKNGHFAIMLDGKLVECKKHILPRDLLDLLDYPWKGMPLAMVSRGSFEMYIDLPSHIIPLHLYEPGELFALYGLYDNEKYSNLVRHAYSTTSGARSLITLPKISHSLYNQRLSRKFATSGNICPRTLDQQWGLFNEVCNSPALPSHWTSELIVFSRDFVNILQKTPEIENEILHRMLNLSSFSRSHAMYDLLWSLFIGQYPIVSRNTPFIIETAKHVIKLAMSEAPAYIPAIDDLAGPIHELSDILLNVYKLRYYLPVFMRPSVYNGTDPVYYSLHRHTFFQAIPKKTGANRTIDELAKVQELIEAFKDYVKKEQFPFSVADTKLLRALNTVEFDFFHPQGTSEMNTDIQSIFTDDPRFMTVINKFPNPKNLDIPQHSVFFNGCIRIRPGKAEERIRKMPERPKASMKDFFATIKK